MINSKDYEKDLEFLRERFEHDGLRTPDSLSADAMKQKLAGALPEAAVVNRSDQPEAGSMIPAASGSARNATARNAAAQGASRPRRRRALIAAAACVLLAICLIPAMKSVLPGLRTADGDPAVMTADGSGLYQFSGYDELDQAMKKLLTASAAGSMPYDGQAVDYITEDAADGAGSDMGGIEMDAESPASDRLSNNGQVSEPDPVPAETGTASDHSSTYTQVEGIDEADIVKTDGKYIYYLSGIENQIIIARAKNGRAKRVAAVGGGHAGAYIEDIYIHKDRLIIIGSLHGGLSDSDADSSNGSILSVRSGDLWSDASVAAVYDISDPADPQYLTRYSQTGTLISSRLIGDHLCLVTNDRIYTYRRNCSVPYVSYDSGPARKLPVEDICCIPQTATPAYTVVGLMDLASGRTSDKTIRTKAVLGGSSEIYCSGDHLYIAGRVAPGPGILLTEDGDSYAEGILPDDALGEELPYDDALTDTAPSGDALGDTILPETPAPSRTQILKVSLAGGRVKYEHSALVEGDVNDQFSMDESNGTFKVATTSQHEKFSGSYEIMDVNNLFIFDENMKEIGSVIGFAKDEHIEAVRYIRDKAYVITYEQTDPLFIIDLSDPADPVIEGHVKISGFSTLLVPADADHLLGLGFSTETTEFGEATDGVKLALFDISDPARPEVADSKAFPGCYSEVQYDHKVLLAGPAAAWYAIPYDCENYSEDQSDWETQYGILVFSAKAGRIKVMDRFSTRESVRRCVYIGDYIYGICVDDSIKGFPLR